jgi:hypothetical protein
MHKEREAQPASGVSASGVKAKKYTVKDSVTAGAHDSTKVEGRCVATIDAAGLHINHELRVRKSGHTGDGKGKSRAVVIGKSNKVIYQSNLSLTVGANSLSGYAEKKDHEPKLFPDYRHIRGIGIHVVARDSDGIPDSLKDLTQVVVGALNTIGGIANQPAGQVIAAAGWYFLVL